MQLKILPGIIAGPAWLAINYQYLLSAVIYKVIKKGDAAYARFLHDLDYGNGWQQFNLFIFSDLRTSFLYSGRMAAIVK